MQLPRRFLGSKSFNWKDCYFLWYLDFHLNDVMFWWCSCSNYVLSIEISILQLFDFGYGVPFGHFLNKFLDAIFKGRDNKSVAKKVPSLLAFKSNVRYFDWELKVYDFDELGIVGTTNIFTLDQLSVHDLLLLGGWRYISMWIINFSGPDIRIL